MSARTSSLARLYYDRFDSPIGSLLLAGDEEGLHRVQFHADPQSQSISTNWVPDSARLAEARQQILAFLHGELTEFDLPLVVTGTPFQQRAWLALRAIPYGGTSSYADQATAIGSPRAVRAVGAANGRNPLPIVVPCHRVIGRDGSLTGFGGGIETKRWLLALEARRSV